MKKVFTLFAAVAMLASVSFAQMHRTQPGERVAMTPAAAFKAQVRTASATTPKAVGDTVSTFPWTEGFESGTAPVGFSFIDADNDGFNWDYTYLFTEGGYGHNGSNGMIASASYDITNEAALTPDNWMILPAMQIPTDASDLNLSWYEKSQDADYADEYYSVYISTSGRTVSNFTATTAVYSGYSTGDWVKRTVDLSSYAGQTIHIAFRHHNCTDMFYLDIDDIRVGGPEAPTIVLAGPASTPNNVAVTFVATATASPIEWYVDGTQESATGDTLVYTFTTTGLHEVVASVTNTVGTSSDTLEIDVFSCDNISIPYAPDFTGGLGCWTSRSDSTESGWYASVDMFESNPEGQVLSLSAQSIWGIFMQDFPADNWLFSPVIEMPATGTTGEYEVAWQVKPFNATYDGDHYGVYLIYSGDTTLLFEESLTGMTDYNQRMAVIPSTVSGDFQVAFRHFNSEGGYVIILDSIQVRPLSAPVVTLNGPTAVENGTAATFTAICPNATSFSWTINGIADTTTGNVLTTTFTTDGFYTINVTATNSVGSADTSLTVEVYSCDAITSFPYTQDFETGVRCWTIVTADPANDDRIGIDTTHYNGSYGFRLSSYSTADDYNQYLISPELTLPATGDYMVKFYYKGYSSAESFRIMTSSTTNDTASFTEVANYTETATDWTMVATMLPAGTKYVAIDYYGHYQYYLYVDDITISELNEAPEVTIAGPTNALSDDQVTFTANAPLATSFSWTVDGTAVNESSNTLTTTFTTAGSHTVTVTATNSIGSNSATATITITTCDAITTFPFVADFETANVYDCWKFIDADGDGYTWDTDFLRDATDESGNPNPSGHNNSNGLVASASYINNIGALTPDNWMILPAMTLPEGSSLILSWYAKGQDASYAAENYSVYISTTGSDINDFSTSLYTGVATSDWLGHNVNLAAYAGQTVRIAFRHHDVTDMYYLDIDDIKVATEGVGIDEVESGMLSLYPNPATNMVSVSTEGVEGNVTVQIVDLNGRVMMQQQGNAQSFRFDVSSLAQGAYFVRMTGENVNAVRKLIVK